MTTQKVSIRENAYGNWYGYRGGRRVETFFNSSTETQEQAARKWLASQGTCPDCGGGVDIDPACVVSEPVVDPRTMETHRKARLAKAALCSGCEFCLEL